ncbi:TonB-dependent receptor [Ulvibacter litoralis]|uniref:Iron complex outermembrane recepter protein n=1 Tax=Ulvibacter litoralis TaxID=227084 RepID=A0A1G7F9T9_9FLAO|nr:TonB-dependent receptor [Ulvibacter litoralis]GHC52087.1 TonB-dependent receptor [Ulvibacter litoralis]SDE72626.1 iron complex outermembrane recepter protein [Ulvibacter litoralis]
MKYTCFLLLLCLSISGASAQSILSGKITNQQTNEPLVATVYFPKLEKGAVSDFDGTYSIINIPKGTYTVVYSLQGYATLSQKISFSESETTTLDVQMTESAVEIEEVIISTPFHKLQSDNVMKVERVAVNDLNSKGAVTLADGITNIPGVSSISTGIGIGKPVIRGLSSNRVLTYTQGIRLENQQFGDEHGLGINEAGIESVEVIKGPASLLYGSDALGGVLYINPEKFAHRNETHADVQSSYFSNTLGTATTIGVKTSGEKLKFLARGAYAAHSDYETGSEYKVTNTRFNEKDLKAGLQYQGSMLKSTLRYNYNRSNIGIPEELGEQSSSKELLDPYQEIDNHILSWENKLFFEKSSLDVKVGYTFNDRREFEEEVTPALQLKLNTFNYDAKYYLPDFGQFETIVGVQGMFQKNENFGEEVLIPDATVTDIGVMGTTHYHLENIDLQGGIRFDHRAIESEAVGEASEQEYIPAIDRDFTSFNAAIGAKVDFSETITGRLNLASGFRAPNLAELASNGVHEGTNRYEIGNTDLNNEQNYQLDLSVAFRNEHFEVSANGFYNAIQDYIFIAPTDLTIDDAPVFNYSQDNANLYGGEFGVHIHPHPLDWLHFESSFETVTGKLNDGGYLPLIPANTLRNTFRVELRDGKLLKKPFGFISLQNTFDQKNPSDFETTSEGYNLLSLGVGSTIEMGKTSAVLGLTVTNLTNESYVSHLSRLKEDGVENIGRNIQASVKLFL